MASALPTNCSLMQSSPSLTAIESLVFLKNYVFQRYGKPRVILVARDDVDYLCIRSNICSYDTHTHHFVITCAADIRVCAKFEQKMDDSLMSCHGGRGPVICLFLHRSRCRL